MEDGIPVVFNPKEPVPLPDTPSRLTLIEDLKLGEPDENQIYPFSRLNWLSVENEENIITMDNEEGCIRIFDKTGKLIKRFGRKGQGEVFFDVFDSEGRYIAKFTRPVGEMPSLIKKGKMYSILRDRNELPLLRRYRMVWKKTKTQS